MGTKAIQTTAVSGTTRLRRIVRRRVEGVDGRSKPVMRRATASMLVLATPLLHVLMRKDGSSVVHPPVLRAVRLPECLPPCVWRRPRPWMPRRGSRRLSASATLGLLAEAGQRGGGRGIVEAEWAVGGSHPPTQSGWVTPSGATRHT